MTMTSPTNTSERPPTNFDWASRRVLVTGATGFIGSWLVQTLLARGASVVAFVRDVDQQSQLWRSGSMGKVSIVLGRLEDYAAVERAINEHAVDTVFHLGAQAIVEAAMRSPLPTFESNIRGTYNVLEACRVHAGLVGAVAVASSDKAYGSSENLPYTEQHPLAARHPYDVSKSCTDMLAATYAHSYDLPIAIARLGNVYGGGDVNWSRIVPGTIRSLIGGQRPVIRSDGKMVRDYFYVEDAAAAYLTLVEQIDRPEVRGQAFNFSTGSHVTVLEIVDRIRTLLKIDGLPPIIEDRAQSEIPEQWLSSERARSVLGWSPNHDLTDGLTKTIRWYRDYLEPVA